MKLYTRLKNPFFFLVSFGVFSIFGGGIFIVYHFNQLEDQNQNEIFADINQTFRLQLNHEGGGDVFGDGYYEAGTEARIWAIPNIGYSFKRWVGEDDFILEELNTTVPIFSDINLKAIFVQNEFQLKTGRNISKSMGIRDFEGFETSQYFKDSGEKMMTLKFASADVERPKIGFLRMGLAFLMVRNLEILLVTDGLSANFIHKKINELKKHKGVSYAVAEPVTFWFKGNKHSIKIVAHKGKLTSEGSFRLWGGVKIDKLPKSINLEKLEIKLSTDKQEIIFYDSKSGQTIQQILLD